MISVTIYIYIYYFIFKYIDASDLLNEEVSVKEEKGRFF